MKFSGLQSGVQKLGPTFLVQGIIQTSCKSTKEWVPETYKKLSSVNFKLNCYKKMVISSW